MNENANHTVASPCIRVCQIDRESGLCRGCWRTLAEIAAWPELSEPGKKAVLSQLPLRSKTREAACPPKTRD